jgi:hypothetical protein
MPHPVGTTLPFLTLAAWLLSTPTAAAAVPPTPPAGDVSFAKDIRPLFEASCTQCHAKGKAKGGLSVETREALLKGGDSGPAAVPGKGGESLLVKVVSSTDPDEVMPKKGTKWTPAQVAMLLAWIDKGMPWDDGVTFAKPPPVNLKPRAVDLPAGPDAHPLDRLLAAYLKAGDPGRSMSAGSTSAAAVPTVDDRLFARRAWLDAVGLLPPPAELEAFVADTAPDKRAKLVDRLLNDSYAYADHWLTFWNDLLRNDYKGTGYIDGGRQQVTGWLYAALLANKPYDQFVRELVAPPGQDVDGFVKGIVWRGTVPAAMSVPMQAAQNVSQVFLGVNLKCAGCHDSFVSDWTLADAYGLAAVYSDKPLELVLCDRPTGKTADARFLYPEIGAIDPALGRDARLKRFAELLTSPANGRLSRTVVNRLWAKLLGRGLVEPLDDMEKPAWSPEMLDWLAEDLVANKYDLKRTVRLIMTSRAYAMPVVEPQPEPAGGEKKAGVIAAVAHAADPDTAADAAAAAHASANLPLTPDGKVAKGAVPAGPRAGTPAAGAYAFRGPVARRLSAEQFADAVSTLTGDWSAFPTSVEVDYSARGTVGGPLKLPAWVWTDEPVVMGVRRSAWQLARSKGDAAQKLAVEAQKQIDAGAPTAAAASAKAKDAADLASAFAAAADAVIRNPERAAAIATGAADKVDPALAPIARHKVVFRKRFTLDAVPERALASAAASQKVEVAVNGKAAGAVLADRRTGLYDIRPLLAKGENVVTLAVDSHTERPNLNVADRALVPAVFNVLNDRSGVAFAATLTMPGGKTVEWATDETWVQRRSPEPGFQKADYDDKGWPAAQVMPPGVAPADDGGILTDAGAKLKDRPTMELAPRLPGLVAFTRRPPGGVRASLVSSDPLQLALGRPNREMVVSLRQDAPATIQALELTNGTTLDEKLRKAAGKLAAEAAKNPSTWVEATYRQLLCRPPSEAEKPLASEVLGPKPAAEAVSDFLWALMMQPEFQYVH